MPTTPVEEAKHHSMMAIPSIAPQKTSCQGNLSETGQGQEVSLNSAPILGRLLPGPVVVAGQPPHPSRSLEQTYLLTADCNQPTKVAPTEPPSPIQKLEVAHQWMPTPSFLEVNTCLRGQLPKEVPKAPPVPLAVGNDDSSGVATMSASCVVQDEATGATYLDMVTHLSRKSTLSSPEGKIPVPGPEIEDVTDLV